MLEEYFDASFVEPFNPNYNAAPSQNLPVVLNTDPKHIVNIKWGITPVWLKQEKGRRDGLINIREENLKEKPTFKKDLNERRCLVIADGFYEWKKTKLGKIPYRFILKDKKPFAMAGLWEEHDGLKQFAIITTIPNKLASKVHNRMPVILSKKEDRIWLQDGLDFNKALNILNPYADKEMLLYEVSKVVKI